MMGVLLFLVDRFLEAMTIPVIHLRDAPFFSTLQDGTSIPAHCNCALSKESFE